MGNLWQSMEISCGILWESLGISCGIIWESHGNLWGFCGNLWGFYLNPMGIPTEILWEWIGMGIEIPFRGNHVGNS